MPSIKEIKIIWDMLPFRSRLLSNTGCLKITFRNHGSYVSRMRMVQFSKRRRRHWPEDQHVCVQLHARLEMFLFATMNISLMGTSQPPMPRIPADKMVGALG